MGIGEQAEVTDAMEAGRQHVHQEPAHELAGGEVHDFGAPSRPIVLPAEGHVVVGQLEEPAVGDGDAVRVAREIGKHLLGSGDQPEASLAWAAAVTVQYWVLGFLVFVENLRFFVKQL